MRVCVCVPCACSQCWIFSTGLLVVIALGVGLGIVIGVCLLGVALVILKRCVIDRDLCSMPRCARREMSAWFSAHVYSQGRIQGRRSFEFSRHVVETPLMQYGRASRRAFYSR